MNIKIIVIYLLVWGRLFIMYFEVAHQEPHTHEQDIEYAYMVPQTQSETGIAPGAQYR